MRVIWAHSKAYEILLLLRVPLFYLKIYFFQNAMLKNATRYIERCFQDSNGLPPEQEKEYVEAHNAEINEIAIKLNSKNGQKDYYYNIRELSGGFKTDFSTTESFAQIQVSFILNIFSQFFGSGTTHVYFYT